MFNQVGKKIMTCAKVLFWIILVSVVIGIIGLAISFDNTASTLAILSSLIPLAIMLVPSFLVFYGIGQLVDDVHAIRTEGIHVKNPTSEE